MAPAGSDTAARPGWLRRHPVLGVIGCLLALLLGTDLVLGALLNRPNAGTFRALHPYYHHGFLANVSTTTFWGEREYAMHTNSLGFRDRAARRVALEPAGRRLVVIGDSFVEGIGVTWEESFAAHLQRALGPSVEVLNAGAVSYNPMVYRRKVEYLLEQVGLRFGELLVLIDISDIQDQVNYQSFRPVLPSSADLWRAGIQAFLNRRSFAYCAVTSILRARRGGVSNEIDVDQLATNKVYRQGLTAYQISGDEPEKGRWEWTIAEPLMEAWGHKGLELARADMRALVETCRANGVAVTVGVYPSPVQILMKDEDSIQVRFWREFARETGVDFIDLWPLFVGEAAGKPRQVYNRYFIPNDVHWNAEGHALVARELAQHFQGAR
jgi:hypothetical protein